jgi:outer membrane receptor protein involved in Fe transport
LTITTGISLDQIRDQVVDDDSFNPKLGLLWQPTPHTTIRAAFFESLFSSLTTSRQNPQPRLEPTQIAGFSQLLFGGTADRSTVSGLGLDHALAEHLYIGWEASHRDTDRTVVDLGSAPPSALAVALTESVQQAYLYWTPHDRVSLSARYERGRYHSVPPGLFGYSDMSIERLPIEARYFSPTGFTAGLRASHIRQDGVFLQTAAVPGAPPALAPGNDTFWVLDAFLGYRLPNSRGLLSLSADNLLDERFQFQDVDPETPSVMPERLLSIRFTIAFD